MSREELLFEMSITTFLSLWNGFLFLRLLLKLFNTKEEDRYFSNKIVISALSNFAGWCICYTIHTTIRLNILHNLDLSPLLIQSLWTIFSIVYSIGFVASYIFVISMLYASFNGSHLAISKLKLYSHLFLSVILLFISTLANFFLYVIPNEYGPIFGFINYITYICGLVTLYYLLNTKLIKMVLLATERSKISVFNPVQSKFMLTVTKLCVLQGVFTFTVIVYVLMSVLHHIIINNIYSDMFEWIIYTITVVIGTLSIYLTFHMNIKEYYFFCKQCNKCCTKLCAHIVKKLFITQRIQTELKLIRTRSNPYADAEPTVTTTTKSKVNSENKHIDNKNETVSVDVVNRTPQNRPLEPIDEKKNDFDKPYDMNTIDLDKELDKDLDEMTLPTFPTKITPAPSLDYGMKTGNGLMLTSQCDTTVSGVSNGSQGTGTPSVEADVDIGDLNVDGIQYNDPEI